MRSLTLTEAERKRLRGFGLLTSKAQLVVLNLDEAHMDATEPEVAQFRARVQDPGLEVMPLYGKIESEIAQLPPEEAQSFLQEIGLLQSGLDRFIRTSYELLGLCSFFTAGEKEVRAWTIPQGMLAPQAAGAIHSDLERGFIRAEVIHYNDLIASGSLAKGRKSASSALRARTIESKTAMYC